MFSMLFGVAAATSTPQTNQSGKTSFDAQHNVTQFYGIPVDLTLPKLRRLGFRYTIGHEVGEGDRVAVYTINAANGIRVTVSFDNDGKLYSAETSSRTAVGPKGIGVGSTQSAAKAAWPSGKLLYGVEDGAFVTFVTGSNVLLRFNPNDLPTEAFDRDWCKSRSVKLPEIRVQSISVYPKPNPIPVGAKITCP